MLQCRQGCRASGIGEAEGENGGAANTRPGTREGAVCLISLLHEYDQNESVSVMRER